MQNSLDSHHEVGHDLHLRLPYLRCRGFVLQYLDTLLAPSSMSICRELMQSFSGAITGARLICVQYYHEKNTVDIDEGRSSWHLISPPMTDAVISPGLFPATVTRARFVVGESFGVPFAMSINADTAHALGQGHPFAIPFQHRHTLNILHVAP